MVRRNTTSLASIAANKLIKKKKEEVTNIPKKTITQPKVTAPTSQPKIAEPQIIRDQDTGKVTGLTLPSGKSFLGIGEKETRFLASKEAEKRATPPGAVEAGDVAKQQQEAEFTSLLTENLGNVKLTGDVERDKISQEQAIKSALADAGIGLAGGAAVGAVAGTPAGGVGAVPGAAIGAAAGALGGFIRGYKNNLKEQRQDIIKGEAQNLMKNEQNLLKISMLANRVTDIDQKVELLDMFNEGMSIMDEDYERLTLETNSSLTDWLGQDGHKQLEKYITFNNPGGMREILLFQMKMAMQNPSEGLGVSLQAQLDASAAETELLEKSL